MKTQDLLIGAGIIILGLAIDLALLPIPGVDLTDIVVSAVTFPVGLAYIGSGLK
jgi:hypothetical protein